MTLKAHPTYYDVLDLKPDASPHEIREAYLRTKATYNKDSAALYSLIGAEEREGMLRLIEEAHEILSHHEKRKEYDRHHGLISDELDFTKHTRPPTTKIISIDRVPPMEQVGDGDELLVAPSTDFREPEQSGGFGSEPRFSPAPTHGTPLTEAPVQSPPRAMSRQPNPPNPMMINPFTESPIAPTPHAVEPPAPTPAQQKKQELDGTVAREIEIETEWSGLFIKRVREARRVSIEELSNITKINKSYLLAIEEENFAKLPALVFVRGFLTQIARTLKLPVDLMVAAYLARFNQAQTKKAR